MVDNKFLRAVEDSCDEALCALGAKRPRRGTRYFEVNEDILCWIGLCPGRYTNFVDITPNIGVHAIPVMKLSSEFDGIKYKKGDTATFSTPLGAICPPINEFKFYDDTDPTAEAKRLAQAIFDFGLPYAQKFDTIASIIPELKPLLPRFGGYPENYAISLYLSGQVEQAKQFIAECKAKYKVEEPEDIQSDFEHFSQQLLDKITSER